MKKIFLLFLTFSLSMSAQNRIHEKTKTIDSTIEVLYKVISGDKGVERDWDLFLNLFIKMQNLFLQDQTKILIVLDF